MKLLDKLKIINQMKKLTFLISIIFIISSCNEKRSESTVGEILKGNHKLRKFNIITKDIHKWNGEYFLIGGTLNGSTYKESKVSFSWQMNSGEYAISEIELGKIRVRIDSTVDIPFIKFNWDRSYNSNLEYMMKYDVNYIIITCKEEDYPININLNNL